MSRDFYLGVDGGGTKTEFQCIDAAGELLARHIGGVCYHLQVGVEGVRNVLAEGIGSICAARKASSLWTLTARARCWNVPHIALISIAAHAISTVI